MNKTGKQIIIKFLLYVLLFGIVAAILFLTGNASAVKAAQLTAAIGLIVSVYFSKIYLFLTPRKICGKIVYLNVEVANQRTHPGVAGLETYDTYSVPELTIDIETKDHKIIRKILPYCDSNLGLYYGDIVEFSRFSDFPAILSAKN